MARSILAEAWVVGQHPLAVLDLFEDGESEALAEAADSRPLPDAEEGDPGPDTRADELEPVLGE